MDRSDWGIREWHSGKCWFTINTFNFELIGTFCAFSTEPIGIVVDRFEWWHSDQLYTIKCQTAQHHTVIRFGPSFRFVEWQWNLSDIFNQNCIQKCQTTTPNIVASTWIGGFVSDIIIQRMLHGHSLHIQSRPIEADVPKMGRSEWWPRNRTRNRRRSFDTPPKADRLWKEYNRLWLVLQTSAKVKHFFLHIEWKKTVCFFGIWWKRETYEIMNGFFLNRDKRTNDHPKTPNKHSKYSRRAFDGLVKIWRKQLHTFDPCNSTILECSDESQPKTDAFESNL